MVTTLKDRTEYDQESRIILGGSQGLKAKVVYEDDEKQVGKVFVGENEVISVGGEELKETLICFCKIG